MDSLVSVNWIYAGEYFVVVVFGCFIALEASYRVGRKRRAKVAAGEKAEPRGAAVTSTLALLAFILAFTFGMAGSRYEAKKIAVLDEAAAIGTAYLRSDLLPVAHQENVRALLREYVDVRIKAVYEAGYLQQAITRSEEIHGQLWAEVVAIANQYPPSVNYSLFVQTINDVIDLHQKRLASGVYNQIPAVNWAALYFISILAMASMGLQAGLAGSNRTMSSIFLALSFSTIITVIAVLDSPPDKSMRIVSQQVMLDLQQQLNRISQNP